MFFVSVVKNFLHLWPCKHLLTKNCYLKPFLSWLLLWTSRQTYSLAQYLLAIFYSRIYLFVELSYIYHKCTICLVYTEIFLPALPPAFESCGKIVQVHNPSLFCPPLLSVYTIKSQVLGRMLILCSLHPHFPILNYSCQLCPHCTLSFWYAGLGW